VKTYFKKEGIPMESIKKSKTSKLLMLLIILAVLLPAAAAACVMVTADSYNQAPRANISSILPRTVATGGEITFKGRGIDPDGYITDYSWRSDLDGCLSDQANFRTSSLSEGAHIIYFKVKDSSNAWSEEVTERVKVGINIPQQDITSPVIATFQVNPTVIQPGDSATLVWKVNGAAGVAINGGIGDVPAEGSKTVSPASTTAYTLTAIKGNDTVTANTVLYVGSAPQNQGQPVIHYFKANPLTVIAGEPSVLSWKVTGATSVVIDHGIGSVAAAGSQQITPPAMTAYTLKAANASGWTSQSVMVAVAAGAPDNTPPSVPVLLSPAQNATLPQPTSPWSFDWADAVDSESGIKQYQIYVKLDTMPNAAIDELVSGSGYPRPAADPFHRQLSGCMDVRAQNNAELWSQCRSPKAFLYSRRLLLHNQWSQPFNRRRLCGR
jgi:hypothetical protein